MMRLFKKKEKLEADGELTPQEKLYARVGIWAGLVFFTVTSVAQPFFSLYAESIGASTAEIGLLVMMRSLLPLFIAMPVGQLIDSLGAMTMSRIGFLSLVLSLLFMANSTSPLLLGISQVLMGASIIISASSLQVLVSGGGAASRNRSINNYSMAMSAGSMLGPLFGGGIVSLAGGGADGYRTAFWVSLACSVAAALSLIAASMLRSGKVTASAGVTEQSAVVTEQAIEVPGQTTGASNPVSEGLGQTTGASNPVSEVPGQTTGASNPVSEGLEQASGVSNQTSGVSEQPAEATKQAAEFTEQANEGPAQDAKVSDSPEKAPRSSAASSVSRVRDAFRPKQIIDSYASGFRLSRLRGVRFGLAGTFLIMFIQALSMSFIPLFLNSAGYAAWQISLMVSLNGLAGLLSRFCLESLVRRAGLEVLLLAAGGVAAVCLIAIPPASMHGAAFAALTMVLGGAVGLNLPVSIMIMVNDTGDGDRGKVVGLRLLMNRLSQLMSPAMFGFLGQTMGLSGAFYTGGAVLLAAVAGFAAVSGYRPGGRQRIAADRNVSPERTDSGGHRPAVVSPKAK